MYICHIYIYPHTHIYTCKYIHIYIYTYTMTKLVIMQGKAYFMKISEFHHTNRYFILLDAEKAFSKINNNNYWFPWNRWNVLNQINHIN